MSRPRRQIRWSALPPQPLPKHPYRDSAIIYGAFAILLIVIAWAAGTSLTRALVLAVGFYIVAMGWSALSLRRRLREAAREPEL